MTAPSRPVPSVIESRLYVAFELGKKEWKLAMTSGFGVVPLLRSVAAGNLAAVLDAVRVGRTRFGLPADAGVVSCYEAGRDGFWVHRALTRAGFVNRVVDSASIEVNRRARRAKTDRIDALKLVAMLVRVWYGDVTAWREVRVPSVSTEAARQVSRERTALTRDQTRLTNQMRGWLAIWGCAWPARRRPGWWTTVRDWAGDPLPVAVQARVARATARLDALAAQIAELSTQQQAVVSAAGATSVLGRLVQLKGVATTSASVLIDEGLAWRAFRNRREIGGFLGFAPMPYDSGESQRDQGISGAGNAPLQAVSIQLAWNWVRWQPESALTRWYRERFGEGKRARRIGIVALARKLIIALWRYARTGVVPPGAVVKPALAV
jgi:transposase